MGPSGPCTLFSWRGGNIGVSNSEAQAPDFVLLVMNPRGAESLDGQSQRGNEERNAACPKPDPKGATCDRCQTDPSPVERAKFFLLAFTRGLIAGISLEGSTKLRSG